MTLSADAIALLNALSEPAFIVSPAGRIIEANRSALHSGTGTVGQDLTSSCAKADAFRKLLHQASGSRQPLPGSLHFPPESGLGHFRVQASLLTAASAHTHARILVRLFPTEDRRFLALTDKVRELNSEVRRRKHSQAVLEETLHENNILLRELHHRVKNNMQMLSGMLLSAQRESSNAEARLILGDAARRLAAVGAVQQLLYGSDSLAGVLASEFLKRIASSVLEASGQDVKLVLRADEFHLANDLTISVALVLNELIANALKYGAPAHGDPEICVALEFNGGEYLIAVADNGPGFDLVETKKRSSGLGLVRGLVRQFGGTLAVERANGARVLVRFRDRPALGRG